MRRERTPNERRIRRRPRHAREDADVAALVKTEASGATSDLQKATAIAGAIRRPSFGWMAAYSIPSMNERGAAYSEDRVYVFASARMRTREIPRVKLYRPRTT